MKSFIKWLKSESPIDTVGGLIAYCVTLIAFARLLDWLVKITF
jgi:hypothetical protein